MFQDRRVIDNPNFPEEVKSFLCVGFIKTKDYFKFFSFLSFEFQMDKKFSNKENIS